MQYGPLGRSSVQVSALCLGCMNWGSRTPEEECVRIMDAALEAGINFFDTSNSYSRGVSEEIVGRFLSQDNRREQVVLATKVSSRMGRGPNEGGRSSRYHIVRQCEESLRRLQTDRIDLYQLHILDITTPLEESMRALDDLVRQGKVVYTGCSKWAPSWIVEAIMLCDRHGWTKLVSEQPPYNILDRSIENELVWTCMRHGIGIIPWAPIAAGILSGKYVREGKQPEGSRFKDFDNRLTPAALDIVDALTPLAEAKGVTLAELALAWVMRQPGITAPITGPRTLEHLQSSLKALDVEITDADRERIDEVSPPGTKVSDYYDINVYRNLRRAIGV
jgi:aryl-alcohol dehydrogenase-like predicted oxidoreductase